MSVRKLLSLAMLSVFCFSSYCQSFTYNPFDQAYQQLDSIEMKLSNADRLLKEQESQIQVLEESLKEQQSLYKDLDKQYRRSKLSMKIWRGSCLTLTVGIVTVIGVIYVKQLDW